MKRIWTTMSARRFMVRGAMFILLCGFSLLLCAACPAWAGVRRPFPQHVAYAPGTIKPSHVTQTALDNAVSAFYETWKTYHLKAGCESGHYYVFAPGEDDPDQLVVSEGQGYGMIITALMAGYDSNAKTYFDGLYWYYKDHPSQNHPYLMAWKQVTGCVTPADENGSATDGDLDIAYALLLADGQWGSVGAINYRQEALNVIQAIMAKEINPNTWSIMLGDGEWAGPTVPKYYYGTRTSDFMLNHLRAYQLASGDARWGQVLAEAYNLIAAMQTTYSPDTGLLPDFIQDLNSTPQPAAPSYLEGAYDGNYYYNACRDPWRIGVEYLLSADPRAKAAANAINTWIRSKTGGNPANIHSGYNLDGAKIDLTNNDPSMAFIAPLGVGAMVDVSHQAWLNNLWDLVVSYPREKYYEDTLKLLAMLVMSGNWWTPSPSSSYLLWTK